MILFILYQDINGSAYFRLVLKVFISTFLFLQQAPSIGCTRSQGGVVRICPQL